MSKIRMSIAAAAASLMALSGAVHAQSADVDERTSQSEMQRGVPGVDVDTGSRADGAVDVDTNMGRNESERRTTDTDANARDAGDLDTGARAARADRN